MKSDAAALEAWYKENSRPLPWRRNKSAYSIWLSEIMLQQTTVQAVIPYHEKFLKTFPRVEDLAHAPLEKVLEMWSGLGYYSRARLLHRSAQALAKSGFPKTHTELLELPGFGPYTSRAVSSIAFGEKVGIVDGNSIRVLSRRFGQKVEWWTPKGRAVIQDLADAIVAHGDAGQINQAFMDLGATVCTPTSPKCFHCPWIKNCAARDKGMIDTLPLSKPRRESEVWVWRPMINVKKTKGIQSVELIENDYAPFLKGQWMWPGEAVKMKSAPRKFAFSHAITHHKIYVIPSTKSQKTISKSARWVKIDELKKVNPSSLLTKTLKSLSLITSVLIATVLVSCQSPEKRGSDGAPFKPAPHTAPPSNFVTPNVSQLTQDGESLEGYFNKTGTSIIFVSQNRSEHIHPQVYEMILANKKERRLTFHDGEDSCPFYLGDGSSFVYSSTTDEIKEGDELFRMGFENPDNPSSPTSPALPSATAEHIKKIKGALPPFELYESRVNGSKIERLTVSAGYDSEVSAHSDGKKLVFTSFRSGDGELYLYDMKSHGVRRLTNEKGQDGGAFFSRDSKRLVWRHISTDFASSQIMIASDEGKNPKQLTTKGAHHWAPYWHPSGEWIVFSSNRDEVDHFELYLVDTKGLCLKRLTYDGTNNSNPSFSPDGTKILFTSNRSGRNQLYLMDFNPPASCAGELP